MKNRICITRKYFALLFISLIIVLVTSVFLYISRYDVTSLKTRAAMRKIINPSPIPIQKDEFPYYAILHDNMDYYLPNKDNGYKYALNGHTICGGSLIANDWVITAAHCVENRDINTLRIALNMSTLQGQLDKDHGEEDSLKYFYKVEMVILHPAYSSAPLYDNDIALIQLNRNVPPSVTRLQVPTNITPYDVSKQLTIVGVGCIDIFPTPGLSPPYSKDQYQKKYSLDIQKGYFSYKIQDKSKDNPEIFLTNPQNIRKSVCSGDSGSPMVKGSDGTLLGVAYSWITGDFANPGYGTLTYTRSAWIQDIIAAFDKIGKNCTPKTDKNYMDLILQKVRSTNNKLVINVSSKDDLYITVNIIRDLKSTLDSLSNKEIWINYSCDEVKSNSQQESMSLQNIGTCNPIRRYESCIKLERGILLRIYKNETLYDNMSNFNIYYGPIGAFMER